ncbi:MAG: hypothetical protein WCV92_01750 [Candidatus Buchananbacteria bacterium]
MEFVVLTNGRKLRVGCHYTLPKEGHRVSRVIKVCKEGDGFYFEHFDPIYGGIERRYLYKEDNTPNEGLFAIKSEEIGRFIPVAKVEGLKDLFRERLDKY